MFYCPTFFPLQSKDFILKPEIFRGDENRKTSLSGEIGECLKRKIRIGTFFVIVN
jgi:hypothetical protein